MLQNYEELFKLYAFIVDSKRWLRRSPLEVVKKFDKLFHFKIIGRVL